MSKSSIILVAVLAGVLVIGGAVAVYLFTRPPVPPPFQRLFRECAKESGIDFRMVFLEGEQGARFKGNLYDHGAGLAVGDFDGDGWDDIYFVNQKGKNGLYRNKQDGTFENVTEQWGVAMGDRVCVAATFADYDNDGHQSLFVTSTHMGNILFRNDGTGKFVDVTEKAGLKIDQPRHSQGAVFFDYDNDGYLDLYVTNTAKWTLAKKNPKDFYYPGPELFDMPHKLREKNILYHNNRDGTFTDVTAKSGLAGRGMASDVVVFDYNDDGYLDVVVTDMFGRCQLYRNDGNGTFTDVTKETLGRTSYGAIGARVFDFNNDGKLDLLITDMHSDMWTAPDEDLLQFNLKKKYDSPSGPRKVPGFVNVDNVLFGNVLYQNLGAGKFDEVSEKANMETWWPWGSATGDFDNDGYEDVFIPAGMGHPFQFWPNSLMMNNGDGTFTDRAEASGIEPPPGGIYLEEKIGGNNAAKSSRCAAVADFRRNGQLDIVVNNFNAPAYFFRNEAPKKNYVSFRLTGKCKKDVIGANRDAIGALVKIYMGKEVMVRQVQGAGGYLSQSSLAVHFGLGDRKAIDRVEIQWPSGNGSKSGTKQVIQNPEINKLHLLNEP